ncbi:maleylpyruvate isomerase N-terminal domain-containing protein [Streptomyces sp. NPDC048187]|uniref:maleylpyruvate isomerase N-terminal domain-containing protein n=1 Tax=Streptomyces sp. NPDC048187 TaxID=3365509 RepID=UPI0037179BDC
MTTRSGDRTERAHTVRDAYEAPAAVVRPLGDQESWLPTACTGWAVRDLVFHLLADARRAPVALHTPAAAPPDRDAVTYWRDWAPHPVGAAHGRRSKRVAASMFLDFGQLKEVWLETVAAAARAAGTTPPDRPVVTQGHVLTAGDLMTTLAVEATVHHLDLTVGLPAAPGPAPACRPRSAPPWTASRAARCRVTGTTRTTPARAPDAHR